MCVCVCVCLCVCVRVCVWEFNNNSIYRGLKVTQGESPRPEPSFVRVARGHGEPLLDF